MLLHGLRKDGMGGYSVSPGVISDVPEPFASRLIEIGAAAPATTEPEKVLNIPDPGLVENVHEPAPGTRVLLKM